MAEKLNAVKFGLAGGIVTGICVALTTLASIYGVCTECTDLIRGMYDGFGYSVGWLGALLGGIYGFIDMFIVVFVFAWVYNKLL